LFKHQRIRFLLFNLLHDARNVTATTHYLLINGSVTGSVTSYAQYDIAGNVVEAIDGRGMRRRLISQIGLARRMAKRENNSGATELGGQYTYAFPTLVTKAGFSTYTQFDFYLGRPVNGEDANGIISSGYYNDPLEPPHQARRAVGTTVENQTTFQLR